jgi:hypothetical protein
MVPYAKAPFREGGDNITRLLMEQGRLRADSAQRSGDIWGQAIQSLGQQAGGAIQAHAQQQQEAKRDAQWVAYANSGEWAQNPKGAYMMALKTWGPKEGQRQFEALMSVATFGQAKPEDQIKRLGVVIGAMDRMGPDARAALWPSVRSLGSAVPEVPLPEQYDEEFWKGTVSPFGAQVRGEKPEGGFTLSEGQTRFGPDGKPVANVPAAPPKPANLQHIETADGIRTFDPSTGKLGPVLAKGKPPASESNPAKFWVIRNGKALRVSEAEYQPGDLPANTREQGRPVVSGDAGRIADLDTSLDDLDVLDKTLMETKGATGSRAKAGALLPNAVTELTGWGEDAKKRQGVIDRVKQVIGKALEGGVLRKEDEYKYEKILPTIGDTQAVAESKLKGLRAALQKRRETTLDALDDAGYDVSKYRARKNAPAAPTVAPEDDALLKKYGY